MNSSGVTVKFEKHLDSRKSLSPRTPRSPPQGSTVPRSILKKSSPTLSPLAQDSSAGFYSLPNSPVGTEAVEGSRTGSDWELTNLTGKDGRLDVDAVASALGIGLGLGLGVDEPSDDDGSDEALSAPVSPTTASTSSESPCPGSCGGAFGWGGQGSLDFAGITSLMMGVTTHVHGLPLSIIPEETKSEMGSVLESPCVADGGMGPEVSIEMDSGDAGYKTAIMETTTISAAALSASKTGWDESWREEDSRYVRCPSCSVDSWSSTSISWDRLSNIGVAC